MLQRFPIITLQIPATVVYRDGNRNERVVAVVPAAPVADWACRWCYGRPMPGYEVCSRVDCITHWQAVLSLDSIVWRGEDR